MKRLLLALLFVPGLAFGGGFWKSQSASITSGQKGVSATNVVALDANDFPRDGSGLYLPGAWITLAAGGIPFIMPGGWTSGSNGAITGMPAINHVEGWSYIYIPANDICSGTSTAAGWYLFNDTSSTAGTVYNYTYSSGTPSIPGSPTAFSCTGVGAVTQTTGIDIPGPNVTVPANSMGLMGSVYWEIISNNINSATSKIYNTYFGGNVLSGTTETTTTYHGANGWATNRGVANSQVGCNGSNGCNGSLGGIKYLTTDTTQGQIVSEAINLNSATDYAIIESFLFALRPR